MHKTEIINKWRDTPENLPILPHFEPIPYKAEGSRYGACGIRIDGNPAFIDAVLSHLKELLVGEGITTRLCLSRNDVNAEHMGKSFDNRDHAAQCCYIRLQERGDALGVNRWQVARRFNRDRKISEPDKKVLRHYVEPTFFDPPQQARLAF